MRTNSLVMEFINYNQSLNLEPLYKDNGGIVLPPPYHRGNTIINPVPVPVPSPVPNAFAKEKEKGIVKGEEKTRKQTEPVIAEMLTEIKAFLGYPDKTNQDPIPNYAKEGQFLKKMLGRHFTREEILSCWKTKAQQRRGEFISLAWVNEDIAAYVESGRFKAGCRGEKPIAL